MIDNRVVGLQFENAQFEREAQKSLSTLTKLNDALQFTGVEKSLDKIASGFDTLNNKISLAGMAAAATVTNIVNQAVNSIRNLINEFTVGLDDVMAGWGRYQEKTNSVGMLRSQGYALEEVNKQMARLNWFTDETSYNFTDMASNIGKFTAMNIPLKEATDAMQGIALWTAKTGGNAAVASRAMYNLTQSMGAGYLTTMDYKSLALANMNTAEWKQIMAESAEEAGTIQKVAEGIWKVNATGKQYTTEQLYSNLSDRWASVDSMMIMFKKYSQSLDQIYEYAIENDLTSSEAIEALQEQGDIDEFSLEAFRLGSEAKNLQEVVDATKDAVATSFMETSELIFGNYEQAKIFFTKLVNEIYDLVVWPIKLFNKEVLTGWNELGGRLDLLQGFWNIFHNIQNVIVAVKEGMREVFPPMTSERLVDITKRFKEFTERIYLSSEHLQVIKMVAKGFFSVLSLGIKTVTAIVNGFKMFFNTTNEGGRSFGYTLEAIIYKISAFFVALNEGADSANIFEVISYVVSSALSHIVGFVKAAINALANLDFAGFGKLLIGEFQGIVYTITGIDISGALRVVGEKIVGAFGFIVDKVKDIKSDIVELFGGEESKEVTESIETTAEIVEEKAAPVSDFLTRFGQGVKSVAEALKPYMPTFGQFLIIISKILEGIAISSMFKFADGIQAFGKSCGSVSKALSGGITNVFKGFQGILEEYQNKIKAQVIRHIAVSIAILAASLLVLSMLDVSRLTSGFVGLSFVLAALLIVLKTITKIAENKNMKGIDKVAALASSLKSISVSILVLSIAAKIMGTMSMDQIISSVTGISGIALAFAGVMKIMANTTNGKEIDEAAKSFAKISWAINFMLPSIVILGLMGNKALIGMAAVDGIILGMVAMTGTIAAAQKDIKDFDAEAFSKITASMIVLSIAVDTILPAVILLGAIPPEMMGQGMLGLFGILSMYALIIIGVNELAENSKDFGANVEAAVKLFASLLILAIAVNAVVPAILVLGAISPSMLGQGMLGMLGIVAMYTLITVGVSELVNNSKDFGANVNSAVKLFASLLILAVAINAVIPSILVLGAIPIEMLGQGALGVLGIVSMYTLITVGVSALVDNSSDFSANVNTAVKMFASLLILALAINMVVPSIIVLGMLPADMFYQGMLGLIGITTLLSLFVLVMGVVQKEFGGVVTSGMGNLLLLAIAINLLVIPVYVLGGIDTSVLKQGFVALTGIIALLSLFELAMAVASKISNGGAVGIAAETATLGVALSLILVSLVPLIQIFSNLNDGQMAMVAEGLMYVGIVVASIVAIFAIFMGVTGALKGSIPALFALAGAIAVLSLAFIVAVPFLLSLPTLILEFSYAFVESVEVLGKAAPAMGEQLKAIANAILVGGLPIVYALAYIGTVGILAFINGILAGLADALVQLTYILLKFCVDFLVALDDFVYPLVDILVKIICDIVDALGKNLYIIIETIVVFIVDLINALADVILDQGGEIFHAVDHLIENIWLMILGLFGFDVEAQKRYIDNGRATIHEFFDKVGDWFWKGMAEIGSWITNAWTWLKAKAEAIGNAISTVWNKVTGFVKNVWSKISGFWTGVKDKVVAVWNWIKSGLDSIKDFFSGIFESISGVINDCLGFIQSAIDKLGEVRDAGAAIGENFGEYWLNGMKQIFKIESPSKEAEEIGEYVVEGFVEGEENVIPKVEETSEDIGDTNCNTLSNVRDSLEEIGKENGWAYTEGVAEGAAEGSENIKDSVEEASDNITETAETTKDELKDTGDEIVDDTKSTMKEVNKAVDKGVDDITAATTSEKEGEGVVQKIGNWITEKFGVDFSGSADGTSFFGRLGEFMGLDFTTGFASGLGNFDLSDIMGSAFSFDKLTDEAKEDYRKRAKYYQSQEYKNQYESLVRYYESGAWKSAGEKAGEEILNSIKKMEELSPDMSIDEIAEALYQSEYKDKGIEEYIEEYSGAGKDLPGRQNVDDLLNDATGKDKTLSSRLSEAKRAYDDLAMHYRNGMISKAEFDAQVAALEKEYSDVLVDLTKYIQEQRLKAAKESYDDILTSYKRGLISLEDYYSKVESLLNEYSDLSAELNDYIYDERVKAGKETFDSILKMYKRGLISTEEYYTAIEALLNEYEDVRMDVEEYVVEQVEKYNKELLDAQKEVFDELLGMYKSGTIGLEEFKESYAELLDEIPLIANELAEYGDEQFATYWQTIVDSGEDALKELIEEFQNGEIKKEDFTKKFLELQEAYADQWTDIWTGSTDTITSYINNVFDHYKDNFESTLDNIISDINNLASSLRTLSFGDTFKFTTAGDARVIKDTIDESYKSALDDVDKNTTAFASKMGSDFADNFKLKTNKDVYDEKVSDYEKKIDELNKKIDESKEKYGEYSSVTYTYQRQLDSLTKEYEKYKEAHEKGVESGEIDEEEVASVDFGEKLEKETKDIQKYNDDLNKLLAKDFTDREREYILDLLRNKDRKEGQGLVTYLLGLSDEEMDKMFENWYAHEDAETAIGIAMYKEDLDNARSAYDEAISKWRQTYKDIITDDMSDEDIIQIAITDKLDKEAENLKELENEYTKLVDRRLGGDVTKTEGELMVEREATKELVNYIASLTGQNALEVTKYLNSLDDAEFARIQDSYANYVQASEDAATALYSTEIRDAWEEYSNDILDTWNDMPEEFKDIGAECIKKFYEGFTETSFDGRVTSDNKYFKLLYDVTGVDADMAAQQIAERTGVYLPDTKLSPYDIKKLVANAGPIGTNIDAINFTVKSMDAGINDIAEYMKDMSVNLSTIKEKLSKGEKVADVKVTTESVDTPSTKATLTEQQKLTKIAQSMQKKYGKGNVDLTNRPFVSGETMRKAGYNVGENDISTVYTSTEFIWQGDEENGEYVAVHFTPILPNGEVLTEEEMARYLHNTLEGSTNILSADTEGLVLKVDTGLNLTEEDIASLKTGEYTDAMKAAIASADTWDEGLHRAQEAWMNQYFTVNGNPYSGIDTSNMMAKSIVSSETNRLNESAMNSQKLQDICLILTDTNELMTQMNDSIGAGFGDMESSFKDIRVIIDENSLVRGLAPGLNAEFGKLVTKRMRGV